MLPDDLNPGIKRTVEWLNREGFRTVDSGDGATHDYECDRTAPYVVVACAPTKLVSEAIRLRVWVQKRGVTVSPIGDGPVFIQASYDPTDDSAFLDLNGADDALLFGKEATCTSTD
jgi:hypothetical protein